MNKLHSYILLTAVMLLTAVVGRLLLPPLVEPVVRLTMLQNSQPVNRLVQEREVSKKQKLDLDVLEFRQGDQLIHSTLGPLGLRQNFFLEFDTVFEVHDPGLYRFAVTSDDGFRLTIDGKRVSEFLKDREFSATVAERHLAAGSHRLRLSYFQGGGPLGLKAEYAKKGSNQVFLVGEQSRYITFSLPD